MGEQQLAANAGMIPENMPQSAEVNLLKQLCLLPSPSGSERPVAFFLADELRQRGWKAKVDAAGNVVGEIGHGEKQLLFLGHIDTAPGNIPVEIRHGNLYGRGAVDAKGPIAAFLSAVERVKDNLALKVTFIGAVGEETPFSPGANYIVDKYLPDYCIVGEPSGWDALTVGYKGCIGFEAEITCSCGHSTGPSSSAAELAVIFWNKLLESCEKMNAGKDTLFGRIEPSLNQIVTKSDGLKDTANLQGGLRLPLWCEVDVLKTVLQNLMENVVISFTPSQPAFKAEKNTVLARSFLRGIREAGGQPVFKVKSGTADMNIVGPAWKCPILAYGPGDSSLDHTPFEHLSLLEYAKSIQVLSAVLQDKLLCDKKQ